MYYRQWLIRNIHVHINVDSCFKISCTSGCLVQYVYKSEIVQSQYTHTILHRETYSLIKLNAWVILRINLQKCAVTN